MNIKLIFKFIFLFTTLTTYAQRVNFESLLGKPYYGNNFKLTSFHPMQSKTLVASSMLFSDDFHLHENFKEKRGFYFNTLLINKDFQGSVFEKDADFSKTVFFPFMDFSDAIFKGMSLFLETKFEQGCTFTNTKFLGSADFRGSNANHFNSCLFEDFTLGYYNADKEFMLFNCIINYNANFRGSIFKRKADFSRTTFKKVLDLSNVTFFELPNFDYTNLPNKIILNNVKLDLNKLSELNQKIDFRLSKIDSLNIKFKNLKCKISVEGADIDKILLPYNLFELEFDSLTTYEIKCNIFESIIKTCKDNGMIDSAEGWDIEFQKFQNESKYNVIFSWLINTFHKHWWNFGHDKWKILVCWLPLFFLLFWIYNIFRIKTLYTKMYRDEDLGAVFLKDIAKKKKTENTSNPDFSNLKYRIFYALFYTAVIYFGFKLKHEAVNFMYTRGLLYLYLIYITGAVHVAFGLSYILNVY